VRVPRSSGLITLLLVLPLLTGCTRESARQAAAREAVVEKLSIMEYDTDGTRCTGDPAPWFVEKDTTVFVCAARRVGGGCDWYEAKLGNAGWVVVLQRRNAGCVLPFS
jgi:hypothetical protein